MYEYNSIQIPSASPVVSVGPMTVAQSPKKKERLLFIDNLRLAMIILVVLQHAAVTYSGLGSWYYYERVHLDKISFVLFGLFQGLNQAYFMGILFLIAGYFVPAAYDRKGFGLFVKDRLIRLGIPTLIYMLLINPFIGYVLLGFQMPVPKPAFWSAYLSYVSSGNFLSGSGPLWFALALLIFSIVYALLRLVSGQRSATGAATVARKISTWQIVLLIALIAVATFAIRQAYPAGATFMNMQLGYFAQYILLFTVGTVAYRQGWFESIDYSYGSKWLKAALTWGLLAFPLIMFGGGIVSHGVAIFNGGWHWQSAAYASWESFTAVAMSIGLISLFRQKYNRQSKLVKILSDNSFAVYVFHAPVLISISLLMASLAWIPIAKFAIVAPLALAASFALTYFILRRLPVLKAVL